MSNNQQQQLDSARQRAANATTVEAKSRADADMVQLITQKPRR